MMLITIDDTIINLLSIVSSTEIVFFLVRGRFSPLASEFDIPTWPGESSSCFG